MTWPSITINQYNTYSSTPEGIENTLLFVGKAKKNNGNVMPVNANSDLDALLGSNECALKNCVQAALLNAGQNAFFYVCVLPEQEGSGESTPRTSTELWRNAILKAQETISAEGIVLTEPVSTKDEINAAQALRQSITEKYQRWVWFILTVSANDRTQSWAEYIATLTTLQKGIAAPQ
ncbi:DUF2586 family protein, partial [Escherichia coli]|nr:DUF2586 family protein [Escherichia coli]